MTKSKFPFSDLIFPLYSHPIWAFGIFIVLVLMVFSTQYFQNQLYIEYFAPVVAVLSILSLITPIVAFYLYRTFLSLQETVNLLTETNQNEWFVRQKMFTFGLHPLSVITVTLIAIGGFFTNYYLVWGVWSGVAQFFYFLHVIILFGILGMLGWAYFGILLFSYRLKYLDFDLEPFETKKYEFDKLNSSFLGIFSSGVILYLGAASAGWLSFGSYMLEIPILRYWIFPFAIVVIGFFILIQYFLHQVMKKAKEIRVNKFSLLIRKHYREWENSQSNANSTIINDLLSWKEKIEKESEFPFDVITFASVVATVLLPVTKAIIDLL